MFAFSRNSNGIATAKDLVLLASSVVLAVCFDILLVQPAVAVSYPVFIMAAMVVAYGNNKQALVRQPDFGWFLAFPLIALAMTRFLFTNQILAFLNTLAIPVLFVAHILLVTGSNRHNWFTFGFLRDIFGGLIIRPFKYVAKPLTLLLALACQESELPGRTVPRKVLTGVILSLPVLVTVVILLASADQVFDFFVATLLAKISLSEVARHSLLVAFATLPVFSFLWGLNGPKASAGDCGYEIKKFDRIIVISALSMLTTVYVLFCAIQFSYLFGGIDGISLPADMTYAGYARKGFFELVAVALINTGLIVGSLNFAATSGPRTTTALKALNSTLVLTTFIMLFSAHYRMWLYEETYGYTYLRVFTHAFMAMVLVMLCVTLYKVWFNRINLAKWYIVIGLVAYVLVNYGNVDAFIAQKNVERFYKTGEIDVWYLSGLSYDAMPYLIALTRDADWRTEQTARQVVTAKQAQLSGGKAWQGYNLSEQRAKRYLAENPPKPREFNSALWRNDKYQRAALVNDLLVTQNLKGKSKQEVLALIGNPESGNPSAEYYAWPLWSPAAAQGYEKVLWIRFTNTGRVDVYSVEDRSNR